ncbi:MAG: hypothetical protein A2Y89_03135 [Chloroflexi bacterium RBG_13_51_18]|nr:MAG: hypothetical protein A2Y89_03135 [Chloroflexi bacterium RBG_13_51_18]
MSKLRDLIREKRRGQHLTQEELANKIGISTSYIGILEIGRQNPGARTLKRICDALNIPLEEAIPLGLYEVLGEIQDIQKQKTKAEERFAKLPLSIQKKLIEIGELMEK